MNESIKRKLSVSMSIVLLASAPAASIAANPAKAAGDQRLRVSISDLDLESSAGIATLYQRLQTASRRACDSPSYLKSTSITDMQLARQCYKASLAKAVDEIGNAELSRLHES